MVHAHFDHDTLSTHFLYSELIGNNSNRDCELVHYSLEEGLASRRIKLFDKAYLLHQVVGLVQEGHLVLLRVSETSRFLDLVDQEGHTIHSLRLDPASNNYEFHVSLSRSTLFLLENTNEKFIEKFKIEVPTVLKFVAYRVVPKRSLYAKLLATLKLSNSEIVSVLQMLS